MTVSVEIPMALPSAGNMREHPMARHRRIKAQRSATLLVLKANEVRPAMNPRRACPRCTGTGELGYGGPTCADCDGVGQRPMVVTFTRVSPRKLDDDNLAFAFKGIRDEVAAYFGMDDADPRIEWRYAQAKGKAAVRIDFEVVALRALEVAT